MKKYVLIFLILCALALSLYGCGGQNDTALTEAEAAAIYDLTGVDASRFTDITGDVLTGERTANFRAAAKVHQYQNLYAFIVRPIAYNGPITVAVVIDGEREESLGIRIVEHVETPYYVRDMENAWFVNRFAGRSVHTYLRSVRLVAHADEEIVAITGATVTTDGIINGVNAAFGIYQEFALGLIAEYVPYMVRFERSPGTGPVETGYLAIRAYGVVLAEVSLEEIRALPSVRRMMSIHSSAGVTEHSFRGTLLSHILDFVDPSFIDDYSWVVALGVDGFTSGIGMDEVRAENNVFVVYEDNGEPLPKIDGTPGAMRVIVISDVFGQRFTNYMTEIILESERHS
ncbi:MAG: FMN-binding protein [Oscillospiraceae bacterium]|nr:FMN-binding protein [Oscillospiraceae bacterium]